MTKAYFVCFALTLLVTAAAAEQTPTTEALARVPSLAPGTVWMLKDSARCDNHATVRTRNIVDRQERDKAEITLSSVATELERQVTVTAGTTAVEGAVEYTKATLKSEPDSPAAVAQARAIQGRKYPLSAYVNTRESSQDGAVVARDRLREMLSGANVPLTRTATEREVVVDRRGWAALSGGYLGDTPPQGCQSKPSPFGIVTIECTSPRGYDGVSYSTLIRLGLDATGLIASTDITQRRTKETVTPAATPDEAVVRTESRECRVQTTQSPVTPAVGGDRRESFLR